MNVIVVSKSDIPEHPTELHPDVVMSLRQEAHELNYGRALKRREPQPKQFTVLNKSTWGFTWGYAERPDSWVFVFEPMRSDWRYEYPLFIPKQYPKAIRLYRARLIQHPPYSPESGGVA